MTSIEFLSLLLRTLSSHETLKDVAIGSYGPLKKPSLRVTVGEVEKEGVCFTISLDFQISSHSLVDMAELKTSVFNVLKTLGAIKITESHGPTSTEDGLTHHLTLKLFRGRHA